MAIVSRSTSPAPRSRCSPGAGLIGPNASRRADLIYAGKVDHGFDTESAKALRARLTPLIPKTQPYSKRIAHRGIWVEPELLAEIEYRAKSAQGKVPIRFTKV
jgi:bifunctional non-homologous end joining protein LigD